MTLLSTVRLDVVAFSIGLMACSGWPRPGFTNKVAGLERIAGTSAFGLVVSEHLLLGGYCALAPADTSLTSGEGIGVYP